MIIFWYDARLSTRQSIPEAGKADEFDSRLRLIECIWTSRYGFEEGVA